jgi:alpha/beta superfamily hydrolase
MAVHATVGEERRHRLEPVCFETRDGLSLEGEIRRPDGGSRASAVLCHPHPEHGGSKDHPLLWAIRNDLASLGFTVLVFNFRGVMGSEGRHESGRGETEDVRAAVSRVRTESAGPTFVTGWSFGANVALREAMEDERVGALALIGMPLAESSLDLPELPDRSSLKAYNRPVLLLSGAADPFSPAPDLRSLARRLGRATVSIVDGTDHFFWHRERDAARAVGEFAEASLLARRS